MRIGSLCSGAGGLDMAVERVFGATTAWHCEIEPAASKVLAHRWPEVPNHHDLTTTDWNTIEPVDILTGGYPCQPFSSAGKRKGVDDERHIWPHVREAIRRVRPRIALLENVSGHRSLGFDRVLGDLAEDGMHVRWHSLRASDVGAPHRRERLFVVVTNPEHGTRDGQWARPQSRQGNQALADTNGGGCQVRPECHGQSDGPELATSQRRDTHRCGVNASNAPQISATNIAIRGAASGLNVCTVTRAGSGDSSGATSPRVRLMGAAAPELATDVTLLPTPRTTDAHGAGAHGAGGPDLRTAVTDHAPEWGKYAPAIARWENVTRPAPSPTEPNKNGNPRLSARFSEWLMGWPDGWVTDVPGISRNDQLRIIGNGVVPQCAEAALRQLLAAIEVPA